MTKAAANLSKQATSIAVSIGEPAGIGPDIILDAWSNRQALGLPHFTVIGSVGVLEERAQEMGIHAPIIAVENAEKANLSVSALPVIETSNPMRCKSGNAESRNSAGVIEAIETGVKLVMAGEFSALTTCPINKKALYDCGFEYPGHTEYLASLSAQLSGTPVFPVMMLAGPELRTVPVTIHIALSAIKNELSPELIIQTARVTHHDFQNRLGIQNPVLAIAGVNPHAGEEGSMGREEIEFIAPAIEALQAEGINAIGPLPADTMFHKRARAAYDVALCMYHDQALIPAKTLGFDDAVNVTLGLPFVRTSPDHGTAYDLAGTGKAKPDSFIAALKMAAEMAEGQALQHWGKDK